MLAASNAGVVRLCLCCCFPKRAGRPKPSFHRGIMNRTHFLFCLLILAFFGPRASASVFGDVRGTVLDPQRRPVVAAKVTLQSRSSSFSQTITTNDVGEFTFRTVPIGEYSVTADANGFSKSTTALTVLSDRTTILSF